MLQYITKKIPLSIVLVGVLMDHLAYYLILPILPIMLLKSGLLKSEIGIILGTMAVSFQIGSIAGGLLGDRIGRKSVISIGSLLRAIGLFSFGFFDSFWMFFFAGIITGMGGGMDAPSMKASIASIIPKEKQTMAFSKRGIAANIGMGTAGLIVFFLTKSTHYIFYVSAGLYIILALISWLFFPKNCGDDPCPKIPRSQYRKVLHNKAFMWFAAAGILIWMLYTQLALVIPLRAATILAEPKNVSLIWTINSFIVIVFQGVITSRIINKIHPLNALALGILFIGAGISSLYWANGFLYMIGSGIVFIIGEMLIMPTVDSAISRLSKSELVGLSFGVSNVISGLGEGVGLFVGGEIQEVGGYVPWLIYGISGIVFSLLVIRLKTIRTIKKAFN